MLPIHQLNQANQVIIPGRLHPLEIKKKYGLNETWMAIYFGKSVRTIEYYCSPSANKEIPDSVQIQAWLLDYFFTHSA